MKPKLKKFVPKSIHAFLKMEAASGVILGVCAVIAMVLANSGWSNQYFQILQYKILNLSLQHWINDGLMTIFFFVIGMEIKKEMVVGELSTPKKASLPIAAAIGGMIIPALIYFWFNPQDPNLRGWGIPMATDIAFALGVLTLFGSRVPLSLKVFLLALAIVDDLGAVLVIAFFYTDEIRGQGLGLAALCIGMITLLRSVVGVRSYFVYFIFGLAAWVGVLFSGVHATVAGVVIGLLTPFKYPQRKDPLSTYSPLEDLVHVLHPWVGFVIMPVFALANAGIALGGINFVEILRNPIHQGVAFGLVLGKPLGIILFSFFAVALGFARLPLGLRWPHILGVGFLGGIGFTMALFISGLALSPQQEIYSKTGIVLGSLIAGIFGSLILIWAFREKKN